MESEAEILALPVRLIRTRLGFLTGNELVVLFEGSSIIAEVRPRRIDHERIIQAIAQSRGSSEQGSTGMRARGQGVRSSSDSGQWPCL